MGCRYPLIVTDKNWFENWFGEEYLALYPHRSAEAAKSETQWIIKTLGLSAESFVLDVACGAGRHLSWLSQLTRHACGGDLSAVLLQRAKQEFPEIAKKLSRHDIRSLPFRAESFDAALSLFTSFGYFETDDEHRRALSEMRRVVKPGGRILLDFFNAPQVIQTLVPETRRVIAGKQVIERRRYDLVNKRIEKEILIGEASSQKRFLESVRAYTEAELRDLFDQAKIELNSVFGGFDGSSFKASSERIILIGTR